MNAKTFFTSIRQLDALIEAKLEQSKRLRSRAERMTSVYASTYSRTRRPANSSCIDNLIDLASELEDLATEIQDRKRIAAAWIASLDDPTGGLILELRYFNGNTWVHIALATSYSVRQVQRIHNSALAQIQKRLDAEDDAPCRTDP